jgi:hypothetical protein
VNLAPVIRYRAAMVASPAARAAWLVALALVARAGACLAFPVAGDSTASSISGDSSAAVLRSIVPFGTAADSVASVPVSIELVHLGSRGQIRLPLPRVERGPVVDGSLDDPVWTRGAVLDSFTHQQPVDGVRDTLGTRCLVLYDDHNVYFGFRCSDRTGGVRAPLVPRDKVTEGDYVSVAIDGYYDFQHALVFGTNPRGVQLDGIDTDADGFDDAPDFQFRSEGRLTPEGWEAEIAVPFRSLRFPERDTVSFGFNAARFVSRDNVTMFWAPISLDQVSTHAQQGTFDGLTGIRPGSNLQITPGATVLKHRTSPRRRT